MMNVFESIKRSVSLLVGKAVIGASRQDGIVSLDISQIAGERHTDVPLMQHYGIVSRPKKDSEAIVLFIGGSRDNGIAIASKGDESKIPSVKDGEVCLFSEYGQKILLKDDGSILVTPAAGKKIRFDSDVEVTGDLKVACDGAFVTLQNHTHLTPVGMSNKPTEMT